MPSGRLSLITLVVAGCASTPWTPLGLGVTREHQVSERATSVYGARLGLVSSHNQRVAGVDLNGWRGAVDAGSGGVALALAGNEFAGNYYGVQITPASIAPSRSTGSTLTRATSHRRHATARKSGWSPTSPTSGVCRSAR